jgi:hypothetical protein
MSRFALDQLFMHGHFVSPAALVASGLLEDPAAKRVDPVPAKPEPRREPASSHDHGRRDHLKAA